MPYNSKEKLYAAQAKHRAANKERLWELLLRSTCIDCGMKNPIVLEFDHLPHFEKKFDVSTAISGSTRSWKLIQSEIDKCEIVCANCHRIRTALRAGWGKAYIV
jgi:hypothetical protein